MFIDMNGWSWSRRPELDEGEETVLAIAAGELDQEQTAAWLRGYLVAPDPHSALLVFVFVFDPVGPTAARDQLTPTARASLGTAAEVMKASGLHRAIAALCDTEPVAAI